MNNWQIRGMKRLSIVVPRIVLSWMWRFSCAPHLLTTIRFSQSCIYTFEKTNYCNHLTPAHTITHCQLDPTSFADWFFISCQCLFWNHVLWQRGDLPANPSHAKKWEGRIYKSVGFSFVAIAGKINESIWQEEFLKKTTIFNSKPDAAEGLQCRFPGVWLEGSLSQWEALDWEQAGQVVPLCARQLEHSSKVFSDQSVFTWVQVSVSTPSSTANWNGPLLYSQTMYGISL